MPIRRIVPIIKADVPARSRPFYTDFLGLDVAMERDEIITFSAPGSPTTQLSVVLQNESAAPHPEISIEVSDVDEVYARATEQGITVLYPLTDEHWGVRRFFALDPNGATINILTHT